MNTDHIEPVGPGDLLSAERDARIIELLGRQDTAPDMIGDAAGWHHLRPPRRRRRYAKAQLDWEENGTYPNGDPRVWCRRCKRDGSGVSGEGFWVYLPRSMRPPISDYAHDADPYVFVDFVIAYELDCEGTPVCVSEYLHQGKIGDLKEIKSHLAIGPGWQEADGIGESSKYGEYGAWDFKHRFSMGRDAGGQPGETVAGLTGGYREHGAGINNHDPHGLLIYDHWLVVNIRDHDPHGLLQHNQLDSHIDILYHDDHPEIQFDIDVVVDAVGYFIPRVSGDGFGTTETADGHTHQVSVGGAEVVTWIHQPVEQHANHFLDLEHSALDPHGPLYHVPHYVDSPDLIHNIDFDSEHSETDNRPPWKVVIKIERYK